MPTDRLVTLVLTILGTIFLVIQFTWKNQQGRWVHISSGFGMVACIATVITNNLIHIDPVYDWRYITHLMLGVIFFSSSLLAIGEGFLLKYSDTDEKMEISGKRHSWYVRVVRASYIASLAFAVLIQFR